MRPTNALVVLAVFVTCLPAYAQCRFVYVKSLAPPNYPPIAKLAKLQGTVKVKLKLAANGKIMSASASGADQILNGASKENAIQWVFSSDAAKPQGCDLTITYVYKLEGEPSYNPRERLILELPTRVELIAQPVIPL